MEFKDRNCFVVGLKDFKRRREGEGREGNKQERRGKRGEVNEGLLQMFQGGTRHHSWKHHLKMRNKHGI